MNSKTHNTEQGYVAVFAVLIASAVSVLVLTQSTIRSTYAVQSQSAVEQALVLQGIAHSCTEIVMHRFLTNVTYTGNETIHINEGTCMIDPIDASNENGISAMVHAHYSEGVRTMRVVFDATDMRPETVQWTWVP